MKLRPPVQANPTSSGHPIAVVAERTGLSRDVLRVWERRYGAVEPTRAAGGQRLYSDDDVSRFRLLAAATRHGRSIRHVAHLSTETLATLVTADAAERSAGASHSDATESDSTSAEALQHVRRLDGWSLDRSLRRAVASHGLPSFLQDVVPGLMHSVGDEWAAGELTVAHEHLASAAVLAILFEAMRGLPVAPSAQRLLVATPAGEYHAVGAALAATAAALDGWIVVYLGENVPSAAIVSAAASMEALAILLSVVYTEDRELLLRNLRAVRNDVPGSVPIIVGGAVAHDSAALLAGEGLLVCETFAGMRDALASLSAARNTT